MHNKFIFRPAPHYGTAYVYFDKAEDLYKSGVVKRLTSDGWRVFFSKTVSNESTEIYAYKNDQRKTIGYVSLNSPADVFNNELTAHVLREQRSREVCTWEMPYRDAQKVLLGHADQKCFIYSAYPPIEKPVAFIAAGVIDVVPSTAGDDPEMGMCRVTVTGHIFPVGDVWETDEVLEYLSPEEPHEVCFRSFDTENGLRLEFRRKLCPLKDGDQKTSLRINGAPYKMTGPDEDGFYRVVLFDIHANNQAVYDPAALEKAVKEFADRPERAGEFFPMFASFDSLRSSTVLDENRCIDINDVKISYGVVTAKVKFVAPKGADAEKMLHTGGGVCFAMRSRGRTTLRENTHWFTDMNIVAFDIVPESSAFNKL